MVVPSPRFTGVNQASVFSGLGISDQMYAMHDDANNVVGTTNKKLLLPPSGTLRNYFTDTTVALCSSLLLT
jgi:hypothetical protein